MQRLYFVRHGESEANASKIWSPYNSPLTDLGRWQAQAAGCDARARGLEFHLIVSSPQPRALETAKLIAEEIGHDGPIQTLPFLRERDWGDLAGQPEHHYFEQGGTLEGLNDLDSVEHIGDVQMRAANTLALLHAQEEQNILLVGHGDFGRALVREINGQHWQEEYNGSLDDKRLPQARIMHVYPG